LLYCERDTYEAGFPEILELWGNNYDLAMSSRRIMYTSLIVAD